MTAHNDEEKKEQLELYELLIDGLRDIQYTCDVDLKKLDNLPKSSIIDSVRSDLQKTKNKAQIIYDKVKISFIEFAHIYNE